MLNMTWSYLSPDYSSCTYRRQALAYMSHVCTKRVPIYGNVTQLHNNVPNYDHVAVRILSHHHWTATVQVSSMVSGAPGEKCMLMER